MPSQPDRIVVPIEAKITKLEVVLCNPEMGTHVGCEHVDPTAGDFVLEHDATGQQVVTPLTEEQVAPTPNDSRPIWELVIDDMRAKHEAGTAKYGTPLQAFNGRDPLVDLYQELLDACAYVRQKIEERPAATPELIDFLREHRANAHWYSADCTMCVAGRAVGVQ